MRQRGQILVLTLVVVGLVLINSVFVISNSLLSFENSGYSLNKIKALNLAEAAVDKALVSLNATAGAYVGETNTAFGGGVFDINITTINNTKTIQATGYIPNKTNPKSKKIIIINAGKGNGVAFNYGLQVGEGGLVMQNNSEVENGGSVYSNGNVTMQNNSKIYGDLIIAGGVQPNPDQQTDCSGINCSDFIFGKVVSGNSQLDAAQSFKPSANLSNYSLSKVELKLKKVGNPPDIPVRILGDLNGKPNKNNVIATSTIPASLLLVSYSFIPAAFSSPPTLVANTTYWILLDTSANSSNYYSWQQDSSQPYFSGNAAWSPNWQSSNPTWNNLLSDFSFKTYMGGVATSVTGSNGAQVLGNVKANSIIDLTVGKDVYYQAISNSTAAAYHPNSSDPGPSVMPVSDSLINQWKSEAEGFGVFNGDITSCPSGSWGPGKFVGNVTFSSCSFKAKSPIWITGTLTLNNSNNITLDNSYQSDSGIIVVDSPISIGNGNVVKGTGTGNSEIIVVSTLTSHTSDAITVNNTGNQVVLYAGNGIINIGNTNNFEQLTAWKLTLSNGSKVDYNSGFSSLFFTSGPSGAYSLIKGTYQFR